MSFKVKNGVLTKYTEETGVTAVVIPAGVTRIGNRAFYGCRSLTSIEIPAGVTRIGWQAFDGCSSLTSITIPAGVTRIGDRAFFWCRSLTSITIPAGVTSIGERAFDDCSSLTSITIPAGVTSIGVSAFWGCSSLTSITIPAGVTSVGDYAFCGCSSLTSITFEECSALKSIGEDAFYNCSKLTSITIPRGVKSIGSGAFSSCSSLERITVEEGNSKYHSNGNCIIETASKTLIVGCKNSAIPSDGSVTSIGDGVFSDCRSLTSITIPAGLTSIGEAAFSCCSSLESITVEEGNSVYHSSGNCIIETASKTLVVGCKNSVIPSDGSVASIEDHAFYGCSSLTSITIPAGVTSIGKSVFYRCPNLGSILNYSECYWNSLTSKDDRLGVLREYLQNYSEFEGKEIEKTYLDYLRKTRKDNLFLVFEHDSVEVLEKILMKSRIKPLEFDETYMKPAQKAKAIQCIAYLVDWQNKNITFDKIEKAMEKELTKDPFNATDMKKLWKYEKQEDGTIRIDKYKGKDEQVIIPERIGKDTVTSIGYRAFSGCSSLTSITFEEGSALKSIGWWAFEDCSSLTSITIPSGVESIGGFAFYGCSTLTNITFEDTSNWYKIYYDYGSANARTNWQNKRNGTAVSASSLSNASTNASNFSSNSSYYDYFWYKKS